MQITIIKSNNKINNVEDFKEDSKYFSFIIEEPEKLTRKILNQLLEEAGYRLFFKEKSEAIRKELETLNGKEDPESKKRFEELIKIRL